MSKVEKTIDMKRANWNFMPRLMSICFAGTVFLSHGSAQEQPKGIVPVDVEELFEVLPKQVENWKLTESRGWQGQDVWLESSATRTFESAIPGEDGKSLTRKVTVTIQDTGKYADSDIVLFTDFTPGEEDGVKRLYMNSVPVIVIEEGTRLYAQFFLQGRFVLSILFQDLPKRELGNWFKEANVRLLAGVKEGPMGDFPESYISRSIDELEGRNDSTVIKPVYEGGEDEDGEE